MNPCSWVPIVLDYDRTTEFENDVAAQYSALCDLGREYEGILLYIPDLDTSTVSIAIQRDKSIATVPKLLHYRQTSDNATAVWATTNTSEDCYIFIPARGIRYFRVKCGSNQTANRTFQALGINQLR